MIPPEFSLRSATRADRNRIRALVYEARINPSGLRWENFIVAQTHGGEIIGCGQIKRHRDDSLELASIVVTPAWRGKGVARAIIEYLLGSHPETLYLMCRSSLGPFYHKFGFRAIEDDEMPRYFRKVKRLSKMVEVVRRGGEFLLVMRRKRAPSFPLGGCGSSHILPAR